MKSVFILASMLSVNLMFSQIENKQDYIWMFNNDFAHDGLQAYVFDFNRSDSIPKALNEYAPVAFSGNNASICDKDGNLLFYTNGCFVADRNHDIMPNGTGLNDGEYIRDFRNGDCSNGHIGLQDVIILEDPSSQSGYYLLHKRIEIENDMLSHTSLLYSYIDMTMNNGLGDLMEKNEAVEDSLKLMSSYLTAIRHKNAVDWWIIQPVDTLNLYVSFLLSENGFSDPIIQKIGPEFHSNASASGTTKFSPDGSLYAYFNDDDNLLLFDFDRESGRLSNLKTLEVSEGGRSGIFTSIEFSPNGRFIYLAITDTLWQVDTWEENLEDGLELIDVWNGVSDPFPTTFILQALAPDCKIYMCSGSGTLSYHVINEPNKKGKDCDFVQQGIRLPFVSATATMPNFPRFRVDDDKKCDPGITSVFGDLVFYRRDLNVYPNPFADRVTVELPENQNGQIVVFDMQGQVVWKGEQDAYRNRVELDLSHLQTGTYSIEFLPKLNEERLIYTQQLIKVD